MGCVGAGCRAPQRDARAPDGLGSSSQQPLSPWRGCCPDPLLVAVVMGCQGAQGCLWNLLPWMLSRERRNRLGWQEKTPSPFTWVNPEVLQPCFLITGVVLPAGQGQFHGSKLILPDLEVTEMLKKLFPHSLCVRPYIVLCFIFWSLGFYLFLVPSQYWWHFQLIFHFFHFLTRFNFQ